MDNESANQPTAWQKCLSTQTWYIYLYMLVYSPVLVSHLELSLFSSSPSLVSALAGIAHGFLVHFSVLTWLKTPFAVPLASVSSLCHYNDLLSFRLSAACSPSVTAHPLNRTRNCGENCCAGNVFAVCCGSHYLLVCADECTNERPSFVCDVLTFENGGLFINFACLCVCFGVWGKKNFSIHSSFNPLQASITQIGKDISGACV